MIPALIAIGLLCLLGFPAAFAVEPDREPGMLLGLSFLFGAGLATVFLLSLSLAGIAWTRGSFAAIAVPAFAALVFLALRRSGTGGRPERLPQRHRFSLGAAVFDALTVLAVAGHGIYATLAPLAQWDFWSDWGLKAKIFSIHRGVDWVFLQNPENTFAHPDYPPLLPLTLDFFSLVRGEWEDRYVGLLFTAFGAALLLVARGLLREELGRPAAASLATLALAGPALLLWIGIAEGPLIAYGSLGLLMLRRASRESGLNGMGAALLLGCAALTKNEGLALLLSAGVGLLLFRGARAAGRLWPAAALAAVWLIPRWVLGLKTDLFQGPVLARLTSHLAQSGLFLETLFRNWPHPLLWVSLVAALILAARQVAQERFLLSALLFQLLFYLFSFLVTPQDLVWHIWTSWARLLSLHAFCLTYLASALLLKTAVAGGGETP
jgi:hypothetical protein